MAQSVQHAVQMPVSPTALPGGAPRPPQGSVTAHGTLAVYEPGNGNLVGEVRVSSTAQVREVVTAARGAQNEYRKTDCPGVFFPRDRAGSIRHGPTCLAVADWSVEPAG